MLKMQGPTGSQTGGPGGGGDVIGLQMIFRELH